MKSMSKIVIRTNVFRMYDTKGAYLKQIPIVNLTLRTGYFEVDDNMIYMTQGSFRQGGAAADYVVDPDVSTNQLIEREFNSIESYLR